jgi:hypothetical protein
MAMPVGPFKPVFEPLIVRIGETLPFAVAP